MSNPAPMKRRKAARKNSTLADAPNQLGVVWGARLIGREIGLPARQTFHLLTTGRLPAKQIGRRWCASRDDLRRFFSAANGGEQNNNAAE